MKVVKKSSEYTVYQKRSGRYAVAAKGGKLVNGEEKVAVLLDLGLIKLTAPAVVEEAVEEVVEEAAAEEAPAEEAAGEEAAEQEPAAE
ncbi:hypothetical protein E3W66_03690 [Gammaproteobacteria bacterium LSUCC0057]|uniref:Uncharacterized protein n=1 Tax=Gammaproteobacteria bacterium LSUCC0057 TaxID=2559237 RepID=A0A4Y8UKQ4_9GAMM|nr:hypothetical protein E3W66_03690 [Gammaproteobacteria bacterium LSUCC0057]